MSTFPPSAPSPSISKSEYYSSLPWFRRLLAMLNWRPVVDYELREIEYEQSEREYEKRKIAHEQRMRQLRSESLRVRRETEQIKKENARLAELNSKLDAIVFSSATNSTPTKPTPGESEM
jgi:hypothetical protein